MMWQLVGDVMVNIIRVLSDVSFLCADERIFNRPH